MFIDRVIVRVTAGNGGSGIVSFRREKFTPLGGPDGGDGGKGGDVIIRADSNLATLLDYTYRDAWQADSGAHGSGSNKTGRSGDDIVLPALPDTDPIVRQLVGQLSAHPKIAAWLATDQLIRNFTVVVDNISTGRTPSGHLGKVRPTGNFQVREDRDGLWIDPRSYARYDKYAEAISGLDAHGAILQTVHHGLWLINVSLGGNT